VANSGKFARFTESGERPKRSYATFLFAVGALLMAAALVVLAVPRVIAGIYAVPAREVIGALNQGGRVSVPIASDLVIARQALHMAQAWQNDAVLAIELARIDLLLAARDINSGQDGRQLLDEVIEVAQDGLRRAPAQARGWMILAEATLARDGVAAPKLVDYLTASLNASPYDVWLAPNRAWLAMMLWDRLDARARELGGLQMLLVVKNWNLEILLRIAKQVGDPNPAREGLSVDPALRQQFEAAYFRL